jgi:hypothetical protein
LPIMSEQGSSLPLFAGTSAEDGAINWLEVVNAGSEPGTLEVSCYDAKGEVVSKQAFELQGLSQVHLNVSGSLGKDSFGNCAVDSGAGSALVVESARYYSHPENGRIETAYVAQGRSSVSKAISGSYNLFLDMKSNLRLYNPSDHDVVANVSVYGTRGHQGTKLRDSSVSIAAKSSLSLDLAEVQMYDTKADTYGVVQVQSSRAIYAQLLRERRDLGGVLDFVLSTDVR